MSNHEEHASSVSPLSLASSYILLTLISFQREMIQECYRFVYEDIVFDLSRYLQIPEGNDVYGGISTRLPPFEALNAFDGENKWILTANVGVLNGNDPTQMQKGVDELVAVKMEFEGCFDFQALERHIFDTRVKF